MTSRMFKPWMERVTAPRMEESKIRRFRQAIWPRALGYPPGGLPLNLTDDEAVEIVEAFKAHPQGGPLVTPEQAAKGCAWLHNYAKRLGLPIDIDYREITHFQFIDVHWDVHDTPYWTRLETAPIYRAFWPDGHQLVYWATPWTARAYGTNPDPIQFTFEEAT